MGILNDLRARVQSVADGLRTGEAVRNAVIRHGDDILELQRIQLLEGKRADGEDIRPYRWIHGDWTASACNATTTA